MLRELRLQFFQFIAGGSRGPAVPGSLY